MKRCLFGALAVGLVASVGLADDAVVRRTMEFIGGSGSWKVASNWRDAAGKTNDLPRVTDILSLPTAANYANIDWENFEVYQVKTAAFNNNYNINSRPIILDASGGGFVNTGYIYFALPLQIRGTNLVFNTTMFIGLNNRITTADGKPYGIVKRGQGPGGFSPASVPGDVMTAYTGFRYLDVAEGAFIFNANAKANDTKLKAFPAGIVVTMSGANTGLGVNGNLTLADLTLRETGAAIGKSHWIGSQDSEYNGSLTLTGTPPDETTTFTGKMTRDFSFTWAPASATKTFVFSGATSVSDMTGTLTVSNGTVRLADGAAMTKLTRLVVGGAARFEIAAKPSTDMRIPVLDVATGGKVSLSEGVVLTVGTAAAKAHGLLAGTYTGNGPVGTKLDWLEGAGTLVVETTQLHRLYWRATTATVSTSGDGGALANWSELDGDIQVAAKALPEAGSCLVFDNRLYTKSFAPTEVFNNANKSKGLGGIVFEGTGYVKNGSWSFVWGNGNMYVSGDGSIFSNAVTAAGGPVIWENINLVGSGKGLTIGAVAGTKWTQLRTIDGPAPVNIEGPGTVQLIDYSHSTNPTHEPGQSYYGNYHIAVPAVNMRNGTTEFQCWYKLTNTVVRFDSDLPQTTLAVGVGGTTAGQRDLWLGNGAAIEESAAVQNTTHKMTSTGDDSFIHITDTPGKTIQTFTGNLSGKLGLEFDPAGRDYEFVFSKGTSDTTGSLLVKSGTVRVTDGAKFTALKRILVAQDAKLQIDAASSISAAAFEIEGSGVVEVGKGAHLKLDQVTVDGTPVAPGRYDKSTSWVTGEGKVYVGSDWKEGAETVWTRDTCPLTVSEPTWYKGIRLYGSELTESDLKATDGGLVYLGATGLSVEDAVRYTLGWPLILCGDQTWTFATARFDFTGPFDTYSSGTVTVAPAKTGHQIVFWNASETTHDWWFGTNAEVILRNGAALGTGLVTLDSAWLTTCGGEIANTICFTNVGSSTGRLKTMTQTKESVFTGEVRLPYPDHFTIVATDAPIRFKNKLSKPRGYIYMKGTISIDAPTAFASGAIMLDEGATLSLNAPSNVVGLNNFQLARNTKLFTTVPYALSNSTRANLNMNIDDGYNIWDLCGCDQSVTYLKGGPYATVTSATHAVVHTKCDTDFATDKHAWRERAYDGGVPTNYVCFAGGASLQVDGSGYMRLAGLSSTTGTLTVAGGGLVQVAERQLYTNGQVYKGQWPHASEVKVVNGTLEAEHRQAFGRATDIRIDGPNAKMKLSYTGSMCVKGLYLNGMKQLDGVYGSPSSAAPNKVASLEGAGVLRVGAVGGFFLIR